MNWLTDIARPEIRALRAYEYAPWEPGLVRLHANELPWRAHGDSSEAGLNRYPEPHPLALGAALAGLYGVEPSMLLTARGSDEAIDLLMRSYCRAGLDAIVICPPTFGMYSVSARVQGARIIEVPLRREAGYACDFAAVIAQCSDEVKLVFLCSPNNPSGNRLDRAGILDAARALEGRALLVVDEAYVEFAAEPSLVGDLTSFPGLVVLRTLSKAYGLAGARCGALMAHPDVVALLRKVIQPYALTQLSIEAVYRMLEPVALAAARAFTATIKLERSRLARALMALPHVERVWPSESNFLLVEFGNARAALEAQQRAHAAGVLVRGLSTYPGLEQALRVSVGDTNQNEQLLKSLA
jgi:histidinol-phosphate aminotransferase